MSQGEKKSKSKLQRALRNRKFAMSLLWGGAFALIALLCITVISPERVDLHVGDISKKTITASKDIVDEMTTKLRRDNAAAQVAAVYYKEEGVATTVMQRLQDAFVELRGVQAYGHKLREQTAAVLQDGTIAPSGTPAPAEATATGQQLAYTDLDIDSAAEMLSIVPLSGYQLRTLLDTSTEDIDKMYQQLASGVRTTLAGTIPEGQVNDAITNIQELVGAEVPTNLWWNVGVPTLRAVLQPNMLIDQEATEVNREKARSEIEPVMYKQGQNIVIAGERVTASQLAVLNTLGLIQGTQFDAKLYLGVSVLIALLLAGLFLYVFLLVPELLQNVTSQLLLLLILLLVLGLCLGFAQINTFMLPIALGAMLTTILLGTRVAVGMNTALALIMGMLTLRGVNANSAQAIGVVMMAVTGGLIGVLSVRKRAQRTRILLAGFYVALANALVVLASGLATNNDLNMVLIGSAYALASGPVATVLCVGIQPALEVLFNLVTPAKLLELSNPNQPLLRRLMIEAPGTYHHSMVVANIAEAAAEAVGANPLLVRIGAYYHDVGKLKRPSYFKENQTGENPHDHTDPRVSTAILVSHTRDGVALGQRYRLPQRVLDMIAQHHGDTPVLFFYNKAAQLYEGQPIDVKDFRYEGPKPQTVEAAILMLADTVEAAIRALQDATPEKIEQTIRRLVKSKMEDGQLDQSPLTFRDLDKICDAFLRILSGVFHERIEYPTIEIHPVKELPQEVATYLAEQNGERPAPPADEKTPSMEGEA